MKKDIAEYRTMCGKTLAVVLASDVEALAQYRSSGSSTGNTVACAVVDAICWAQCAFVFVLAVPQIGEAVTRDVHLVKRSKNAPVVQAVECDEPGMQRLLDAGGEDILRELVRACPVDCDAVFVAHASHPIITADQVYDMCRVQQESGGEPGTGGLPYLVSCEALGL